MTHTYLTGLDGEGVMESHRECMDRMEKKQPSVLPLKLEDKAVFSREEAARLVGLSMYTLAKWVTEHKYHPVAGKKYLLPLAGVRRALYTRKAIKAFLA